MMTDCPNGEVGVGHRDVAATLRRARDVSGLSLNQVSQATGMVPQQIHRIETNTTANPSFRDVARLANFYHIPLDQLANQALAPEGRGEEIPDRPRWASIQSMIDLLKVRGSERDLEHIYTYLRIYLRNINNP